MRTAFHEAEQTEGEGEGEGGSGAGKILRRMTSKVRRIL